ncbi:MAG: NUDIX domain-containing protein [Candidatus Woesearchaeota archaeon]
MVNKPVFEIWNYRGDRIKSMWCTARSYKKLRPITQIYGVCFTPEGKVMVIRATSYDGWSIGGGKPEAGETPLQALRREMDEEASVDLAKAKMIGYCKTRNLDKDRKWIYQLRYVALIDRIKVLKPDPDKGVLHKRKFIRPEEFNNYVSWGLVSKAMFNVAYLEFNKWKKKNL